MMDTERKIWNNIIMIEHIELIGTNNEIDDAFRDRKGPKNDGHNLMLPLTPHFRLSCVLSWCMIYGCSCAPSCAC